MQNRKTHVKTISKTTVYRIIAIILALLFVGGIVAAAIPLFGEEASSAGAVSLSDLFINGGNLI